MSQDNLPNSLPNIERLLSRISAADKTQQKEVRITVQEGRDLAIELGLITARLNKTVTEIHQMLSEIKDSSTNINVKFDGGGFE